MTLSYPFAQVTGSFTAAAQTSTPTTFYGVFSLFIGGTFVGAVLLERSPDGGTTYYPCSTDATGTSAAYTTAVSVDVNAAQFNVLYRLRCTAYTSGTINYVMWQGTNTSAV
jgi:hypothetical protein